MVQGDFFIKVVCVKKVVKIKTVNVEFIISIQLMLTGTVIIIDFLPCL